MAVENQFCTFYVYNLYFGVGVLKVQEVFRSDEMTHVPLASPIVKGLINLRGQIITAIDLRRRLELDDRPAGQSPMNIVIRTGEEVVSLLVDEIGEVLEVDEVDREPPPETLSGAVRGLVQEVYKLKDKLLLVLDAERAVEV